MPDTRYRDLAEFGLVFITPDDPTFAGIIEDISRRPWPFGLWADEDLSSAAILDNQSEKSIVALAWVWRYTAADRTFAQRNANLGSSMQSDVLAGREKVVRDRCSFILPGSKRLITHNGMFGDNSDVLPSEPERRTGGWVGSRGGFGRREEVHTAAELLLDVAFFDDGLCAGPDESGLFESVTADVERQRGMAQEIVMALQSGASMGTIFEMLRPLASHGAPPPPAGKVAGTAQLLRTFANEAIHRLINTPEAALLAWFESVAQPSGIRLRRPS